MSEFSPPRLKRLASRQYRPRAPPTTVRRRGPTASAGLESPPPIVPTTADRRLAVDERDSSENADSGGIDDTSGDDPNDASGDGPDDALDPDPADSSDTDTHSFPPCPTCGRPVIAVTVTGPTEHRASPCGCWVHADSLERE
ncbi:hypothetical protein [Natronorubrum tibetense]|uniref:Small CPxCG-related zinc finger protein n=1 Tax=Natronorubrum tibetense GA33 TaxID=1114856 RepID=L9VRP2_9EURY|nr:hypothetical protein [Natronorubrum tibetense]ELY39716.1 hypothetical protein C496_13601 [Natronorubrum tibetense GA33]